MSGRVFTIPRTEVSQMPEPKKAEKKAAKTTAPPKGTHREHDLPWNDKKVLLFKTLKALGAFGASNAKGSREIVEKSKGTLTPRDVRHYSYHAKAANLIGLADVDGVPGYRYFLTAKGVGVDPVAEFKKQESAKKV